MRWTAPEAGEYVGQADFLAIDQSTTTDVHVLHGGQSAVDGLDPVSHGQGQQAAYDGQARPWPQGDTLDFVVGWGNGTHVCDSTGLEVRLDRRGRQDVRRGQGVPRGPEPHRSLELRLPASRRRRPTRRPSAPFDRLGRPGEDGVRLLNLGDPAARQWLTDHVDRLLTEQGIDLYRQDFNMDPLAFWRAADAPDRQGITENQARDRLPGVLGRTAAPASRHADRLLCARGGRRNDLETMRRAVPLWRSDYAFEPIGHQCMTYGISLWLPYHGTGTVACATRPTTAAASRRSSPTRSGATRRRVWDRGSTSASARSTTTRCGDLSSSGGSQPFLLRRLLSADALHARQPRRGSPGSSTIPDLNQGTVQAFRRAECNEPARPRLKLLRPGSGRPI